ncbi:MAG: hypothetical protein FWE05_13395 [Defluviitaleaceae bacterium]|nr:hypothetical protein [Defluviitaleaceae bacterium]
MVNTHKIPLAYDTTLLTYTNKKEYVFWDTDQFPNLAIMGNSGSGKSYFIRLLLGYISKYAITATGGQPKAYVGCFKNELLTGGKRFWGRHDVRLALSQFHAEFEARANGDPCKDFRLLVIDEYISWLASMEAKEAKEVQKCIAELLFMVRSKNMHILLGCHRGMATDFQHGSRDCLNIIFLGSPSKESVGSFVSREDASMIEKRGRGEGYTVFDGQKPKAITVPTVQDMAKLDMAIQKLVSD